MTSFEKFYQTTVLKVAINAFQIWLTWNFCSVIITYNSQAYWSSLPWTAGSVRRFWLVNRARLCLRWPYNIYFSGWVVPGSIVGHSNILRYLHYRPGQAQRVPGSWDSQIARQSAHVGGNVVSPTHRPPLPPPPQVTLSVKHTLHLNELRVRVGNVHALNSGYYEIFNYRPGDHQSWAFLMAFFSPSRWFKTVSFWIRSNS